MSREIYKNIGLIVALLIAGVSLPTAIVSYMRDPIINNNQYNDYYITYYNQTFYGNNETNIDYSKPLEQTNGFNLQHYDWIIRNFNLSSNYAYWYYWNASTSFAMRLWVTRGMFLETIINLTGTIQCYQFLNNVKVLEHSITAKKFSYYYVPPFLSDWLFIFMVDEGTTVNITLTDEILPL